MSAGTSLAVIGAGMAGRSHAHAYRTAQTVFGTGAPPVRLVAIADLNPSSRPTPPSATASSGPSRPGRRSPRRLHRTVSIVVANHLHREIAEGLLAAGKHVLCEKPLAPFVDAEAMVAAAGKFLGGWPAAGSPTAGPPPSPPSPT